MDQRRGLGSQSANREQTGDDAEGVLAERSRTEHGSRFDSNSPKTLGKLDITVDEERRQGFDHPAVHFTLSPQNSQGAAVGWSEGRHVVELEYALAEVFLTVSGEEFFALPLPSIGNGHHTVKTHTLEIDTDGPVYCPADNVDFDLGDGCDAEAFSRVDDSGAISSGDGTHVVWRKSYTDNREVIAFAPPAGMTASPTPAHERQ